MLVLAPPQRGLQRERLLRSLLERQGETFTPYGLALDAAVTPQYAYKWVRELEARGLLEGTRVRDYDGLWSYWRLHHATAVRRDYRMRDPEAFLRNTHTPPGKDAAPYALTTYVGEMLTYHYLAPARWDVYIDPAQLRSWDVRLREDGDALVGPGNVRLLLHDARVTDEGRDVGGLRVVPDALLVLDLLNEGGPCAEAAERIKARRGWADVHGP